MEASFYSDWIQAGQLSISNYFIKHYKQLELTAEEAIFVMILLNLYQGQYFTIDFQLISDRLSIDENQVFTFIQALLQKKCLSISPKKNQQGMTEDHYSLAPLFGQLEIRSKENKKKEEQVQNTDILTTIQTEFGRSLTPIELQTIASWIDEDQYPLELIFLALKEAVLNQVFNLNYMDRVLLAWQRKGYKTPTQVLNDKRRHQQNSTSVRRTQQEENKVIPSIPTIDWSQSKKN